MAPKTNTKQKKSSAFSSKGLDPFATPATASFDDFNAPPPSMSYNSIFDIGKFQSPTSVVDNYQQLYGLGQYGVDIKQDSSLFNNGKSYTGSHSRSYDAIDNSWAQSPARSADGSFSSPSASSTSLAELGNPNLVTDAFASKSSPMSYLGEAWDKISAGADSLGSWVKDTFGVTQANRDYNAFKIANPNSSLTEEQFNANANREQELNNQQWSYGAQAGLGLGNLGLGIMSYLDKSAYNDKAMDLIDQQIANNKDIMKTRKERAADIARAFGSGSAKTI